MRMAPGEQESFRLLRFGPRVHEGTEAEEGLWLEGRAHIVWCEHKAAAIIGRFEFDQSLAPLGKAEGFGVMRLHV
jgi:hypothetical protein